jgi:redox-sensitive bicupin YhaK (pirin superfamily)
VGSADGRDGSVVIHQDVEIFAALLDDGDELSHEVAPGRRSWLQVLRGAVSLNGQELAAGDGAAALREPKLLIKGLGDGGEILLFDLP